MLMRIAGLSLLTFVSLPAFLQSFKWEEHHDCIGGQEQSPIDIRMGDAVPHRDTKPVKFFHYRKVEGEENQISVSRDYDRWLSNLKIHHTGHTVKIDIPADENFVISLDHVPHHYYRLLQIHFHWGSHDNEGSEHTIDGIMSPLEIHFVHKLEKEGDRSGHVNQLTVLGVFAQYQSCHQEPPSLRKVIRQLSDIRQPLSTTYMRQKFNPNEILPEIEKRKNFFFYNGSLTTPPCSETVNWVVYPDPIAISPCSVRKLREMINHDGKKLDKNFRPVQHLHQRNVKYTGDLPLKAPLESILSPRKLEKCRCVMKQKDQMKKEDFEKEVLAIKDDRDDDDDLSPEEFPQEHEEEELEVEIVKQQPSGKVTGGANSRSAHLAGLIVLAVLTWTAC